MKVKAVKITSGQTTKGHHDSYLICATSEQEMEEWISAIENSVFSNPYQQLIEERKRKQKALESALTPVASKSKGDKNQKAKKLKKAADVKIDFEEIYDMANMCSIAVKTAA